MWYQFFQHIIMYNHRSPAFGCNKRVVCNIGIITKLSGNTLNILFPIKIRLYIRVHIHIYIPILKDTYSHICWDIWGKLSYRYVIVDTLIGLNSHAFDNSNAYSSLPANGIFIFLKFLSGIQPKIINCFRSFLSRTCSIYFISVINTQLVD